MKTLKQDKCLKSFSPRAQNDFLKNNTKLNCGYINLIFQGFVFVSS